ncbi:ABC transporter ATP-binding protein/permease [Porticoccaceae bacterium]|nr:ABC transporter ATP-binding protein/permease [Porticoccaceae bacterium]MDB2319341.1 ABC transporter ATP-binding protein/permease [Porticoccaceae bacterium]
MSTLKKAIYLLTSSERKKGLIVLLLVMGMAMLETLGVASVMPFLAVLGNPDMIDSNMFLNSLFNTGQNFGVTTPDDFLIFLGISAFSIIIFSAIYRSITQYVMNRYIETRRHSISKRLLEIYLKQTYSFFLDRNSNEMIKTILSEVDQLIGNVFRPAFNMISYSIVIVMLLTLLIIINPWIAFTAALLMSFLYTLVFQSQKNKLKNLGEIKVLSNQDRFMAIGEIFGGVKDIKLRGLEQNYINRFEKPSIKFANAHAARETIQQVPNYMIEAILFGAMLMLAVTIIATSGGLDGDALGYMLPLLGLYGLAALRLKPAITVVYQGVVSLRFNRAAIDEIHNELNLNTPKDSLDVNQSNPLKAQKIISLENVSYTYPNSQIPTFKDLNLEIKVGSATGIAGTTGAGKTTLVDVMLGLLRPTHGNICVDGTPISDSNLRAWQNLLGYVPQDIFLTDSTIFENIAFGTLAKEIDREQVEHCAKLAQVHDFIVEELPEKYETLVGERGVRLSGGQRQRIGIARALYHNPEILVFDEATSSLDSATDLAVMEAIDNLAKQKTLIIIAHRIDTLKNCDNFVLMRPNEINIYSDFNKLVSAIADDKRFLAGAHEL